MHEKPPTGLKTAGRRLWQSIVGTYQLFPGELAMLEAAARRKDELARLEKAIGELDDLTVKGSMGQVRPHPLLEEARKHSLVLERLIGALNLPEPDEDAGVSPSVRQRRTAIASRWANHG